MSAERRGATRWTRGYSLMLPWQHRAIGGSPRAGRPACKRPLSCSPRRSLNLSCGSWRRPSAHRRCSTSVAFDDAWTVGERTGWRSPLRSKDVTHGAIAESVLGQIEFVRGDLEAARRRLDVHTRSGCLRRGSYAAALCAVVGVDRGVRRPRRARSGGGTASSSWYASSAPQYEPDGRRLGRGPCARAARA